MIRELRDYQDEGVAATYAEWTAGRTRTAIVMATGLGKTDDIAKVATDQAAEGKRVLVLAHRAELLDQITERCLMHAPDIPVGRVQGAKFNARRPITVASSATMARPARQAKMLRPHVVIVDECHHASSPGYMRVLEWAGCFDEHNPTPLMGVTATFTRADKRGLGSVFQSVPFTRDIVWAIEHGPHPDNSRRSVPVGDGPDEAEHGWLVRPFGRVVVADHVKLNEAKVSGGDYQDGELGEMVAQDVDQIVQAWLEHAASRITVAFTPDKASARALADEFRAHGVATGEVYGDTPHPERNRIYSQLGAGEVRVLVSVMVTTEGWDCPPVSCVLMARPTKLPGLYQQIVGRGLRLSPATGKTDCLVLDVVGASRTQRLTTLVDLLPSAVYDDDDLELIPCPRCEGFVGRKPALVALAVTRGMSPCECPCLECDNNPCSCAVLRDPDGGRRRLQGPAKYQEVDLLGLGEDASDLHWLVTERGRPFLAANVPQPGRRPEARFAALHAEVDAEGNPTGLWSAAHVPSYGYPKGELLVEYATKDEARAACEAWARQNEAARRDAPWRHVRAVATEAQQGMARKLGIADPESYTRGGISDAIDIVRASRQLDQDHPQPAAPVVMRAAGPALTLEHAGAW